MKFTAGIWLPLFLLGSLTQAHDHWTFEEGPRGEYIDADTPVKWTKIQLDTYNGEKTASADINKDGRLDIVASNWWYEAPADPATGTWTKHQFRNEGASAHRVDYARDVNDDGWIDIISSGHGGFHWYEHPGNNTSTADWVRHDIDAGANHHQGRFYDLDGDGAAWEYVPNKPATEWYQGPGDGWAKHVLSNDFSNYGDGVGDVNLDGRPDIITPAMWFEAPEDIINGTWIPHEITLAALAPYYYEGQPRSEENGEWILSNTIGHAGHTASIFVEDLNADGLPDLISSCAHGWGLFWEEQYIENGEIKFHHHIVDGSLSENHALEVEDIDGDGDLDLITGKRKNGHGAGADPGWDMPSYVAWYERIGDGDLVFWARHYISNEEQVGVGQQMTVIDIDDDGDLDVITAGKEGGPYLFLQSQDNTGYVEPQLADLANALALSVSTDVWPGNTVRNITWASAGTIGTVDLSWTASVDQHVPTGATSSSDSSGAFSAAMAIDGIGNTRWQAANGNSTGEWLEVNFGQNVSIGKVVIGPSYKDRIETYELQAFVNNAWTTAYAGDEIVEGIFGEEATVVFPAVTTSRMRLLVTASADAPSIQELRFYPGFTTIATGIANTGTYGWRLPGTYTGSQVYLRISGGGTFDLSPVIPVGPAVAVKPAQDKKARVIRSGQKVYLSGLKGYRHAWVYNTRGKTVQNLGITDGVFSWNGSGSGGEPVPPGQYIIKFTGDKKSFTHTATISK